MCAKMSNPDKIKICDEQNTKEMKDLLLSQNMMALDELLESLEDQVYSEVFDSLISIWKMRELAGQEQQSPIPKRTRTRSHPGFPPLRPSCRPANPVRKQKKRFEGPFFEEGEEDNEENIEGPSKDKEDPSSSQQMGAKGLSATLQEGGKLTKPEERSRQKGFLAQGFQRIKKIGKSMSFSTQDKRRPEERKSLSVPTHLSAVVNGADEAERRSLRDLIDNLIPKFPAEKREKARTVLTNLVKETKNIALLTSVLTDKLTKSKKVFGSTVDKILELENKSKGIPSMLDVAFEVVGCPKNIVQEGVYRQNGNMNLILGLKVDVEKGRVEKLKEVKNVHLVTGLVKMFFKDLKEPLISEDLLTKLSKYLEEEKSSKKRSSSQLRKTFMEIFLSPEIKISHRRTLVSLFKHLDEVQKHESKNMMGFQNLAIVLGPTLSRIPVNADLASFVHKQNAVVRLMLEDKQCRRALEDSVK